MREKLKENWGTGKDRTVFNEHKTLGYRRIRKVIPHIAFIVATLDPRTKSLQGLAPADKELVWQAVKDEMKIEKMVIIGKSNIESLGLSSQQTTKN